MPHAILNDVSLHYSLEGQEGKPVLVLSNSLGTSLDMWLPQLERLVCDYRVLRYDTRGHGKSGVTPGPYTIPQLAADVVALLDHLHIERAHFCGLSMGGITGMWLGMHHAERLHKLILCNTAAYIGPPENWTARAEAVQKNGLASIAAAVVSRWLTPEFAARHPHRVADLIDMLTATPVAGYAAACIAVRDADLRGGVGRIAVPTLVVSGTGDLPTPPADGKFLQESIAGAQYVELAAAHLSNQEQTEAFTDAITSFLDKP